MMPGHEAIIAAHKKDPAKTPADAAMAVIAAEKAAMGTRREALKEDEEKLSGLKAASAPSSGATGAITHENAHLMGKRAREYRAAQAKIGNKLTAEQALAHITAQEG